MNYPELNQKLLFHLPPKGVLEPNGPDDPLPYYYKPFIGYLYRARINNLLSLLRPPYKSILELGYGSGILLPTLCSIGDAVYGVDLHSDPSKVKFNIEKIGFHAELAQGNISNADYPNGSFDLIIAISVLEHIYDLSPVVDKVFNLLRPNGHFLVGMPRVDSLMSKAFRWIGYHNIEDHHVTDYRKFLKIATKHFELIKFFKMPKFAPASLALYFSMLLRKP